MWDVHRKFRYFFPLSLCYLIFFYFRVRILGLDNLRDIPDLDVIYVEVGVFHGGEELCTILTTHEIPAAKYPRWNEWLVFNISVRNLPKVMLCLQLI